MNIAIDSIDRLPSRYEKIDQTMRPDALAQIQLIARKRDNCLDFGSRIKQNPGFSAVPIRRFWVDWHTRRCPDPESLNSGSGYNECKWFIRGIAEIVLG